MMISSMVAYKLGDTSSDSLQLVCMTYTRKYVLNIRDVLVVKCSQPVAILSLAVFYSSPAAVFGHVSDKVGLETFTPPRDAIQVLTMG